MKAFTLSEKEDFENYIRIDKKLSIYSRGAKLLHLISFFPYFTSHSTTLAFLGKLQNEPPCYQSLNLVFSLPHSLKFL